MSSAAAAAVAEEEAGEIFGSFEAAAADGEESDDAEDIIIGGSRRNSRGSPHHRLLSIFTGSKPEAVFNTFLLPLPPNWESMEFKYVVQSVLYAFSCYSCKYCATAKQRTAGSQPPGEYNYSMQHMVCLQHSAVLQ